MRLKRFQEASANAAYTGLQGGMGIYALADEVGLGKTLVCAQVAYKLIRAQPRKRRFVFYYVAPSLELLDQNLKSIARYLHSQLGHGYAVHHSISRISTVPLDLSQPRQNSKNIHLIGLSPGTSFKLQNRGLRAERAYLAALFGFRGGEDWKEKVRDVFWCLKGEPDDDFENKVKAYSNLASLGPLNRWRTDNPTVYLAFRYEIQTLSEQRPIDHKAACKLIIRIRKAVAEYLVSAKTILPDFVVFDEWHKYKETCFRPRQGQASHDRLVAQLLDAMRRSRSAKVLFVSATPFSVDYQDLQGNGEATPSADLESLIELFWDPQHFEAEYDKLERKQAAFVAGVGRLLKGNASGNDLTLLREVQRLGKQYETELRRYCVRTERPKGNPHHGAEQVPAHWGPVLASKSVKQFLRQFAAVSDLRSPITAMWMDGHTFPQAGYDGLQHARAENLPGNHWKIAKLIDLLNQDFKFSRNDRLHSFRTPPLWLAPEIPLIGRKRLIFSEFRFVPEEICHALRKAGFGTIKKPRKYSGSVLGLFPLRARRANRKGGQETAQKRIHFALFYPFLFWELDSHVLEQRLQKSKPAIEAILATEASAVETVLRIEALLVQGTDLEHAQAFRPALMDRNLDIPATAPFRECLRLMLYGPIAQFAIGRIAAGMVRRQRPRMGEMTERQRRAFEGGALTLGDALLRLLSTPEAQMLKKHARVPSHIKIPRKWNADVRFALWYCERYRLAETLQGFAMLLEGAGLDGQSVLTEIIASLSLKRGSTGTRFVRSFHDRKAADADEPDGDTASAKSIRAAFNSPFPPYVLASTSVGQEGLDFHRFCDAIIHWTPPGSPSVLRQRQGRLDRFQSLQVRIALEKIFRETGKMPVPDSKELSPDFVVMYDGERKNHPRTHVLYLPYTAQQAAWRRCLERMYYDDLLIGAPDPLSDERRWQDAVSQFDEGTRLERLKLLKRVSISLSPRVASR